MTGTPEPLPDHLVLLALASCLALTFALAYQVRPRSWYFEPQPTPGPRPLLRLWNPWAGAVFPRYWFCGRVHGQNRRLTTIPASLIASHSLGSDDNAP